MCEEGLKKKAKHFSCIVVYRECADMVVPPRIVSGLLSLSQRRKVRLGGSDARRLFPNPYRQSQSQSHSQRARKCEIPPSSSSSGSAGRGLNPLLMVAAVASSMVFAGGAFSLYSEPAYCSSSSTLSSREKLRLPPAFIAKLKKACGEERVTLDIDDRAIHSKPINSFHPVINIPDVVVYVESQEEVVAVVKACNEYKIPVVPYGGATSVEGQILTPHGGISIDTSGMKKIKALHVEDMDIVVEPGIGWIELNEYLKPYGLFFPLDPGPGASIGGMCATRCSGSLAVRYGTMKDNVLALKAVLANGEVIKTANRARKSSAGYDLTRLMIGSEGTLGVITEVTLRLQKIPEASAVAICHFPSVKDAADVAIATMHSGIQVSRVELLDEVTMKALNNANGKNFLEKPTLMLEFIGTEAYVQEQVIRVEEITKRHNGSGFEFFDTPEGKESLWRMRKEALWACLTLAPDMEAMTTDVCVPLSKLADCISISKDKIDATPLICPIISHAGDGNFHVIIMFDPSKEEQYKDAIRLNNFMVRTALKMEGTCTGEHGVGTGKMKYLEEELGMETLKTMKKVKQALDPNNIMNPGKLIPPHVCL